MHEHKQIAPEGSVGVDAPEELPVALLAVAATAPPVAAATPQDRFRHAFDSGTQTLPVQAVGAVPTCER